MLSQCETGRSQLITLLTAFALGLERPSRALVCAGHCLSPSPSPSPSSLTPHPSPLTPHPSPLTLTPLPSPLSPLPSPLSPLPSPPLPPPPLPLPSPLSALPCPALPCPAIPGVSSPDKRDHRSSRGCWAPPRRRGPTRAPAPERLPRREAPLAMPDQQWLPHAKQRPSVESTNAEAKRKPRHCAEWTGGGE